MPAPIAPSLDVVKLGRAVREAEAALCRIKAASSVLLPKHLARRAASPLHALGLARAASVDLVDDSEAFYPSSITPIDGPEYPKVPGLPAHPRDATPEHWARLAADVEAADKLLAELAKAFYRHVHAADRWSEASQALDDFWGGALAARVTLMAGPVEVEPRGHWPAVHPKRRPSAAGRQPLGRGPLVPIEAD